MKKDLLFEYVEILDNEAKRIADIFLRKYKNQEKINMPFEEMVRKEVKKEFKYYQFDILFKVYSYIPNELTTDPNNVYIYVTKEEAMLRHIISYSNFCIKEKGMNKNPKKAASKFAEIIIDMDSNKKLGKISLHSLLSKNMNWLYPKHNDSVDAEAIVYFLQDEIEKRGYVIESLKPLKIRKKI